MKIKALLNQGDALTIKSRSGECSRDYNAHKISSLTRAAMLSPFVKSASAPRMAHMLIVLGNFKTKK